MGYCYMIISGEEEINKYYKNQFNSEKRIFTIKIGRTNKQNFMDRLNEYKKKVLVISVILVLSPEVVESKIIELFKHKFIRKKKIGNEYFIGNIDDMTNAFLDITKYYSRYIQKDCDICASEYNDLNENECDENFEQIEHDDSYTLFFDRYIKKKENGTIKWTHLKNKFIEWFENNGKKNNDNAKIIKQNFKNKFNKSPSKCKNKDRETFYGWNGYILKFNDKKSV